MKNRIIIMAVMSLFMGVTAIFAQDAAKPAAAETSKTPNFSGIWTLDIPKSKLDERQRIESLTLTVTQTDKELKTESNAKRTPPPNGMTPGGNRAGMGGGTAGMGPDVHTYGLDGKERTEEGSTAGGMTMPGIKLKADLKKDGTLDLSTIRKINTPMGEAEISTRDTWTLSADGKTLTIDRTQTSPRGSFTSKMVFNKN